jgi:hypothetical protein
MKDEVIIENLNLKELREYFEVPVDLFSGANENQDKLIKQAIKKNISEISWKKGLSTENKNKATKLAFDKLSYDDRLEYCLRCQNMPVAMHCSTQHHCHNFTGLAAPR